MILRVFFWESGNECRCERTGDTLPRLLHDNLYDCADVIRCHNLWCACMNTIKNLTGLYKRHKPNKTICPNYSFEILFPVTLYIYMYYKNNF